MKARLPLVEFDEQSVWDEIVELCSVQKKAKLLSRLHVLTPIWQVAAQRQVQFREDFGDENKLLRWNSGKEVDSRKGSKHNLLPPFWSTQIVVEYWTSAKTFLAQIKVKLYSVAGQAGLACYSRTSRTEELYLICCCSMLQDKQDYPERSWTILKRWQMVARWLCVTGAPTCTPKIHVPPHPCWGEGKHKQIFNLISWLLLVGITTSIYMVSSC